MKHEVESQDGLRISIEVYAKEEDLYAKEEGYVRGKMNGWRQNSLVIQQ